MGIHADDFDDFAPDDIWLFLNGKISFTLTPEEIGKRLSRIARYSGKGVAPYSIAQHAYIVSLMVSPANAFQAICHDNAETITGDINGVFKKFVPEIKKAEAFVQAKVLSSHGLPQTICDEVETADKRIVIPEMKMIKNNNDFITFKAHNGDIRTFKLWDYETAEVLYISRFYELQAKYELIVNNNLSSGLM
jgi:hypothetical protein